jgi:hypothetical protein
MEDPLNKTPAESRFVQALFDEYNKAYSNTTAGHPYPQWLTTEQLRWVLIVVKEFFEPGIRYYKHIESGSVYQTYPVYYNDGTASVGLKRWNWDQDSWSGHIHDHEKTRKLLQEGVIIVRVSEEEAFNAVENHPDFY